MKFMRGILFAAMVTVMCGGAVQAGYPTARGNKVSPGDMLPAGAVRATVVRNEGELPGGPKTEGRVGDFKLVNSRVCFIIAGVRPASGFGGQGGVVQDAAIRRREVSGTYWYNMIGDVYPYLARGMDPMVDSRLFGPTKAEIVRDGSDGEAVVRITGEDVSFKTRAAMLRFPDRPMKVQLTIEYILRPDSPVLEVRFAFADPTKKASANVGFVYLLGDGSDLFAPGYGFNFAKATGKQFDVLAAPGPGVSYAWFTKGSPLSVLGAFSDNRIVAAGKVTSEAPLSFFWALGTGDVASALAAREMFLGGRSARISGSCTDAHGKAAADAIVRLQSPNGDYLNQADVGPDGTYSLSAAPGDYILRAVAYDRAEAASVPMHIEGTEAKKVDLRVSDPAQLAYDIVDDKGRRIPAVISFKTAAVFPDCYGDPKCPASWTAGAGYYMNHLAMPQKGAVSVRPGKYDVFFTHGIEYEYVKKAMTLKAGGTEKVRVVLRHSVDTTGYLSADFHVHSGRSSDTNTSVADRVLVNAALGIEVVAATDHDMVTDYRPIIKALHLQNFENSMPGQEITTQWFGHFNAFPLKYDHSKRNDGAVEWVGRKVPDFFKDARDSAPGPEIIQLNHPRDKGLGYLTLVGFNPETFTAKDEKNFTLDFDAIEVLNSYNYDDTKTAVLKDWAAFLNRGKRATGTGNSDTHEAHAIDAGSPRNFVGYPSDNPADLDVEKFVRSVRSQNVTVGNGGFLLINVDGKAHMGQTVTDTDGTIDLNIDFQTPSWVVFDTLAVIANGEEVARIPLGPTAPHRYTKTLKLKPARDTWYIAIAEGTREVLPIYPGTRPFAFTNPVYVDVDGNGRFDPPLSMPKMK